MRLRLYGNIFKFGFKQFLAYRSEVWVTFLTKLIRLSSVAFLWSVIFKDPAVKGNFSQILPYFLVADSVQVLVGAEWIRFGRTMIDEIKGGTFSNYLLRPVHPILFMFARYYGNRGVEIITALISLSVGWYLLPPNSPLSILAFLLALLVSFLVSFSLNVIIGNLAFWFTEADGIKNGVSMVIRIFGGTLIPLSFFPGALKTIVLASPIPVLAYLPAILLQPGNLTGQNLLALTSSAIWAFVLLPFSFYFFRKGVKHYEAVGI